MPRKKWVPNREQLERIEALARMGLCDRAIARQLRICRHTLLKRKKDDPDLAYILNRGREFYRRGWL